MSFTTPFTAVAGTAWKAADWNTYGRDNMAWMATDSPACRAYNNAAISIANSTATAVTLNSERFDNAAVHSTSSNTSRLTMPTGAGGKYIVGLGLEYAANVTGARAANIKVNGTTEVADSIFNAVTGGPVTQMTTTSVYAMSAADYFEGIAYQTSGGALNVDSTGNYSPEFWCFWLRT